MSSDVFFTGERFVPGINDNKLEIEHYQRYLCAQKLVKGKIVLDAACGEGYGSNILAKYAQKVIGIDINHEAVGRARKTYAKKCYSNYILNAYIKNTQATFYLSYESVSNPMTQSSI